MRFLFFVLLVLLIAQIGFWHTLAAVLGAVLMLLLLAVILVPMLIIGTLLLVAASFR